VRQSIRSLGGLRGALSTNSRPAWVSPAARRRPFEESP